MEASTAEQAAEPAAGPAGHAAAKPVTEGAHARGPRPARRREVRLKPSRALQA